MPRNHKTYVCASCKASFSRSSLLEAHSRIHTSRKQFKCYICKKVFCNKKQLTTHEQKHAEVRPYQCMKCGKSFKQKGALKAHHITHTGEKPFACKKCGRHFSFKGILKTHYKVHSRSKLFRCYKCGKCFKNSEGVLRHSKLHVYSQISVESPSNMFSDSKLETPSSKCDSLEFVSSKYDISVNCDSSSIYKTCLSELKRNTSNREAISERKTYSESGKPVTRYEAKRVSTKDNVDSTERSSIGASTLTNEKPYQCAKCCKCFVNYSSLCSHFQSHSGEKPYYCYKCHEYVSVSGGAKKHYLMHVTGAK